MEDFSSSCSEESSLVCSVSYDKVFWFVCVCVCVSLIVSEFHLRVSWVAVRGLPRRRGRGKERAENAISNECVCLWLRWLVLQVIEKH